MVVLFLRERIPKKDPYAEIFADYSPVFVPVLEHHTINERVLASHLLTELFNIRALILTSQRAIETLKISLKIIESEKGLIVLQQTLDYLKQKPSYVIGPASKKAILDLGLNPVGSETGHSSLLAELIVSEYISNEFKFPSEIQSHILYLVGDKRRDLIPDQLRNNDILYKEILVYETKSSRVFESDLEAVLKNFSLDTESQESNNSKYSDIWVVFFSPSGINAALPTLQKKDWFPRAKIAAIGPTTGNKLRSINYHVEAEAENPSPMSLFQAMRMTK
ncbi:hypothetical protein HK096_004523 [Nowakowskiella sp. JEL0078]|nr:hypothetical protein HK096_004523 [Nowakowskiella sp. JEL0078]